jgi:hypothetical protein
MNTEALTFYAASLLSRKRQLKQLQGVADEDEGNWLDEAISGLEESLEDPALEPYKKRAEEFGRKGKDKHRQGWHGFTDRRRWADHLNLSTDYIRLYAPLSELFVHSMDPQWHLESYRGGRRLKDIVVKDRGVLVTGLGLAYDQVRSCLEVVVERFPVSEELKDAILLAQLMFLGYFGERRLTPQEIRAHEKYVGAPVEDWLGLVTIHYTDPLEAG